MNVAEKSPITTVFLIDISERTSLHLLCAITNEFKYPVTIVCLSITQDLDSMASYLFESCDER